jgi:phospholipid-binding lipoprotein MlaA
MNLITQFFKGFKIFFSLNHYPVTAALFACLLVSACATVPGPANPKDPFQSTNRAIFQFNKTLDDVAIKPAAQVYRFITPQFIRTGIHNFFSNLNEITVVVNDFLQGKASQGGKDALRFTINTTVGLLGFIDVASHAGLEKHHEDFGLTLGHWGVESGPYLVLPLLGPSTVRDAFGLVPDAETSPYTLFNHVSITHRYEGFALSTIQYREGLLDDESLINEAALTSDHYNFIRDGWLQRRRNQVYDGNPPPDPDDLSDNTPLSK